MIAKKAIQADDPSSSSILNENYNLIETRWVDRRYESHFISKVPPVTLFECESHPSHKACLLQAEKQLEPSSEWGLMQPCSLHASLAGLDSVRSEELDIDYFPPLNGPCGIRI
jgi:hypothetical protein